MTDYKKLRKSMIFNKLFLMDLYVSNSMTAKKTLASATDNQLRLLIQIIFCISTGIIPLPKTAFDKLAIARKTGFLHKIFGSDSCMKRLSKSTRAEQILILNKLSSSFNSILHR